MPNTYQGLWEHPRLQKESRWWSKKNWTSRASYWSCGNKTKRQENPTSDEDFWRVQVHNGLAEGREEGSLAMVREGNKENLFQAQRADQGCQEQEMMDSDDLKEDTTIAQRLSIGVRETWALTATPDGNNQ
jgi:hypothetical protein